jgi:hypothetical protein
MQDEYVGDITDFGKLALLRHLMEGRRLAVCWYRTRDERGRARDEKYFEYLKRADEFRHLAPEIFDALAKVVNNISGGTRGICALQRSGLLDGAVFHRNVVPKASHLRHRWADELVDAVKGTDLVFLDPDNGIQGSRLSPKHVALSEIAALLRQDRTLIFAQKQTGRRSEIAFVANRMRSLGCRRIGFLRFRLVVSRFYVVVDPDDAMADRIVEFARKWGNWVRTYGF